MSPSEAATLLDLPADATPEQIETRYLELQAQLEEKIARAPTDGLKAKYREALTRAGVACDALLHSRAADLLPARSPISPPPPAAPAATPAESPAPRPAPVAAAPQPRRRLWRWLRVPAALALLLLIAAGWFLLDDENRSLREHLIGKFSQSEEEWPEQRAALVQAAKESIGWDDKTPVPPAQRDPDFTATSELHLAVLYNDRPRVAARLAAGDNPLEAVQLVSGMLDAGVSTPVAAALARGRLILARELLRYSAKPVPSNAQSISNYQLTFEQTCATGNWEAIQVLLDFHPPVWTTEAWEVLFASNDLKILERAVRAGADPNVRNEFQETPLHRAARFNPSPALLNALIHLGADPGARDRDGQTPLDLLEPEVARQVLPPTP